MSKKNEQKTSICLSFGYEDASYFYLTELISQHGVAFLCSLQRLTAQKPIPSIVKCSQLVVPTL